MIPLPNVLQAFVNRTGQIIVPWIQYLQQFTIAPPAFFDITLNGSPFSYETKEPGTIFVSSGTVSSITLTRGPDTLIVATSTATPRLIPVSVDDTVTITYTVLPTMKFIPSYGQNTTS